MERTTDTLDLEAILGSARVSPVALGVCLLTSLTMIFDGFDIQAIAFAAPRLIIEWGISRPQLASVLAAGVLAMGVGSFGFGYLGDRYGRRRALISCLVVMAVSSALSARATGLWNLGVWRFLTGLGLGGALPNAAALMVEFAPTRARNLSTAVTVVGVPVGGLLGALAASLLIPLGGWQSIFWLGSALPAALAVLTAFCLPESPRYLATRDDRRMELARLINRVTGTTHYQGHERWGFLDVSGGRLALRALFLPTYRHNTLIIWLIFFSNLLAVYSFFNWIPTLLTGAGLSLNDALRGALLFNFGGVLGALGGALVMNQLGSRPVMVSLAIVGVASCLALAYLSIGQSLGLAPLYMLIFVAGACINGQQVQMFTVTGHAYPTRIRAMGVGAGLASARVGSIASAFAGSVLVQNGGSLATFFLGLAAVLMITLGGVVWLRCHLPPTGGLLPYRRTEPSGT